MATKIKNSKKLKKLNWLIIIAVIMLITVLIFYFSNFNNGLSDKQGDWGAFGDFMGGVLNPIFAFFSLFAIIYTIKIQTQELEYSREELSASRDELEKSRVAQEEQSKSLKLQNQSTKLQSFENTFFQLTDLVMSSRDRIYIKISHKTSYGKVISFSVFSHQFDNISKFDVDSKEYKSTEAVSVYLNLFKYGFSKDYNQFNKLAEQYIGIYFSQIYQILKFIDNSQIDNKQQYVNIFRAQFTKPELELLFYHGLGEIGIRKFKSLLEDYEFFEHIVHSSDIDKPLRKYDIKAFGDNEILLNKYSGITED